MLANPDLYQKTTSPDHPVKMTPRKLCCAAQAITNGTAFNVTDVKRQLFPDINVRTVQENLFNIGLKGHVCCAMLYLKANHCCSQWKWAKEHIG